MPPFLFHEAAQERIDITERGQSENSHYGTRAAHTMRRPRVGRLARSQFVIARERQMAYHLASDANMSLPNLAVK